MPQLVIFGARGQVGQALAERAGRSGISCRALAHNECDITNQDEIERAVAGCEYVMNCAAYTAVDLAEAEPAKADSVNQTGARNIAEACARENVPLIHLSTDYVFDGQSPRAWREDDPTRPLNAYGLSKLKGEVAIREAMRQHLILRTCWVFSAGGKNFVKTILRLAETQTSLRVVNDQTGCPTAADDIANAMLRIYEVSRNQTFSEWGTYHFCGAPAVTWYEFARAIVEGKDVEVRAIRSEDFRTPAKRPQNSVLDCQKAMSVFGLEQPDWREALRKVLGRA